MGPGGSRGLQILRLGATNVRGGFDSHAFPPSLKRFGPALVLAWCLGFASAAGAAAPDSVVAAPDSAIAAPALPAALPADSIARSPATEGSGRDPRRLARPKRAFDEPRWVMLRSLVVPGWGQFSNRAWVKAAMVAGLEIDLGRKVADDLRGLDRIEERIAAARRDQDEAGEAALVNDYNARLDQLTRRQWWLGAAVAYALLDAYIDAHFRNFDAEFKYDPALPGGVPAARVRLSLRWSF